MNKTLLNNTTVDIDENDKSEYKLLNETSTLAPSLEFWLDQNFGTISKALVVGAGVGVASKILVDADVDLTNIEPQSDRFAKLETNCPNSTNINKACASTSGSGTMYYFADNKSGAKLDLIFGDSTEAVDVITVDSLSLTDLDLIVIDVNGKEMDVLSGCTDTLTNNPDCKVIMYWNNDLKASPNTDFTALRNWGFTSINIIHWNSSDNTITLKSQFTGDYPEDSLKVVQQAHLLLE